MKRSVIGSLVTAIFLCVTNAEAGPFGLEMGMTLKDLGGTPTELAKGMHSMTTVPKPHPAFEAYVVKIGPKSGLCSIKAVGKSIETSVYGTQLRSAFNEMEAKLTQTYGKDKKIDILMPGSMWKEPNDFMMGMLKKDRMLAAEWEAQYGSNVTGNLRYVALMARALSADAGDIVLEYNFQNKDECDAEIAAEEDEAL
jgi:hypothetical protein